jgi:hypothetical protein
MALLAIPIPIQIVRNWTLVVFAVALVRFQIAAVGLSLLDTVIVNFIVKMNAAFVGVMALFRIGIAMACVTILL